MQYTFYNQIRWNFGKEKGVYMMDLKSKCLKFNIEKIGNIKIKYKTIIEHSWNL